MEQKEQVCSVAKKCGGCRYQGVPYEEQLRKKQRYTEGLLKKFGKVEPIIGMEEPYYYRNKVHAAFGRDRKGNIISGIYEERSHRIVSVDDCMIEDKKSQEIIRTIRGMLKSFKIKTYDEDTGYGLLRHVLVRRGFSTGEIMVVLVTVSPIFPSKNNFVKALRKEHPEITTVVLNVNDRQTSMVLGERNIVLYGPGFIKDRLMGLTFRISPSSFYQVNPVQTEKLYGAALQFANPGPNDVIWDLYCGIGTISLFMAKKARQVYGVEIVPQAIDDARRNAAINDIHNAEFYVGKAEEVLPQTYEREHIHADIIVVDPPRKGCDESLLACITQMQPKRVVYVSCDPATLARDLKYLEERDYKVKEVQCVDMFGHSVHVETVCLLSRKVPV